MEENNITQTEVNVPPVAEVQNAQPLPPSKKLNLKLIIPIIVVILLVLVGALFVFVSSSSKNQNNNATATTTPTPEVTGQATVTDFKPKNPTLVNVLNSIKTKDNALIKNIIDPQYMVLDNLALPFVWYDKEDYLVQPKSSTVVISLNNKDKIVTVAKDVYDYFISKGFTENVLNTTKSKLWYQGSNTPLLTSFGLENGNQKCMILGGVDTGGYNPDFPNDYNPNMVIVTCSEGDYASQRNEYLENVYDTSANGSRLTAVALGKKNDNFAIGASDTGFMHRVQILKKEGDKWVVVIPQWGQEAQDCTILTDQGLTESDIAALGIKDTNGQCQ